MLMRPDDGGVDHDVFEVWIVGHRLKQPIPYAIFGPSGKADEHAIPIAEVIRQITPGDTCSGEPQDRFYKQAIIRAGPARIARLS
jgi:hypothetical protein